jgi:hypothetical protein
LNNGVGLTGRLIDAFLVNSVFIGNDIGVAASAGQQVSQSTISSNVFSGNRSIGIVVDIQNTVNNNTFDSGTLTTPAQYGLVIRDNLNTLSGNQFGQPGRLTRGDFSGAGIYFSPFDTFGNPHESGTFGYNTIITENYFFANVGPGILAAPNMSLIGVSVLDNVFVLFGQAAIVFNADASSWVRGNSISDNYFAVSANTTAAVVQIARSYYGNSLQNNTFVVAPGVTTAGMIDLDGSSSLLIGNKATGLAVGDIPWRFNTINAQTTLRDNHAYDTTGNEVALFSDASTVTVPASSTVVFVPFTADFTLVPSVADFRLSIVGNPRNTTAMWVSSITAHGFVLNLNQAPGTGSIQVAWSVGGQTFTAIAPQAATEPASDLPPTSAVLPPLPIPDLSGLPTFDVKDYGAWGYGGHDDSSAVLAAINAAAAAGGGIVYFPRGQYTVNQTLPLRQGVYLQGDGANVSQISQGATAVGTMFQADAASSFDRAGFLDLSLNGKYTRDTIGIDFSRISGPLTNIYLDHALVINFAIGYIGAADEQQTLMTNTLFGGGELGILVNGDPIIANCRFNGAQVGIAGNLNGATIMANYFSSCAIGIVPVDENTQRIQNSQVAGNVFTGNSLIGLIVDNGNTIYGNIINGSTAATPALAGLVIRGDGNFVSSNSFGLESGSPAVMTHDFSVGNIVFSSTDWTGNPQPNGTMGSGTLIQHNKFTAQTGPAIVGPSATSLTGVGIIGNSFGLLGYPGIVLNADSGYSVDGVVIADNSFVIKGNLTATVLQISNTQTGNQITGNSFRATGGVASNNMVDIDAIGTTFVGNRGTNISLGQAPWIFRAIDAGTTIETNLAVDIAGNEVGMTETSALQSLTAGQTSVQVKFAQPFALVPTAESIQFTFATWPGSATRAWASNVSATGFTLNLDRAPGTTIYVAWAATGADVLTPVTPTAAIQGPATALRNAVQNFTLTASDGLSTSFTFTIDWGDGSAPQVVSGPSGTQVTHSFASVGSRVVTVIATSTYGLASAPATTTVGVTAVQLVANQQNTNLRDLLWTGTAGADEVQFQQINATTIRVVTLKDNGVATNYSETISGVTGRVLANGAAGDDFLNASGLTSTQATLDGGTGSNTLYGGAAADILIGGANFKAKADGPEGQQGSNVIVGGAGDDTIYGNAINGGEGKGGNNILLGGAGSDTIYGNWANGGEAGGYNILVGGTESDILLDYKAADGAEGRSSILIAGNTSLQVPDLKAVMSEWASAHSYTTRLQNILGVGTGARENGNAFLQPGVTVTNDLAVDQLWGSTGGTGLNWFWYLLAVDQVNRTKPGETLTTFQ